MNEEMQNETDTMVFDRWKNIVCFLGILEEIRNKIQELGIHQTELGRACIRQTQDLRKSIYFN